MPRKTMLVFGILGLTLVIGVLLGQVGKADSGAIPGTANDPLVTKSYVDQRIAQISAGNGSGNATGLLQPVNPLHAGQQLTATVPGTELIVRTGVVTVLDPGGNGLSDVTAGTNLLAGQTVPLNHLIIIPRNDGRGIQVSSGSPPVYLLVSGGYQITGP
jgi:hypothetical protein